MYRKDTIALASALTIAIFNTSVYRPGQQDTDYPENLENAERKVSIDPAASR